MSNAFIIAEAGVNHNGSIKMAKKLIDAAYIAGANAIKFQSFKAGNLVTESAPKVKYQIEKSSTNETQFEMLKKLELSLDDHTALLDYCKEKGITFLSTPFDEECADLLFDLGIELFKIPSGELNNKPLIQHIANVLKQFHLL